MVLKTLRYVESTSDIETGDMMIFVGDRFVVTVRKGEAQPARRASGPGWSTRPSSSPTARSRSCTR